MGKIEGRSRRDDRGWDGLMASPIQWTWVWVNSGSWWWTERPGLLRFMASQSRTLLSNWTELMMSTWMVSVRFSFLNLPYMLEIYHSWKKMRESVHSLILCQLLKISVSGCNKALPLCFGSGEWRVFWFPLVTVKFLYVVKGACVHISSKHYDS